MSATQSSQSTFIDPYDNRVLLDYFDAVEARHSKIRLLGLPSMAKLKEGEREIPIDHLFVQPGFLPHDWREGGEVTALPLENVFARHQRLVVLGDPGSGKSTVVDWLTTAFAHGAKHRSVRDLGKLVPLPLIVRDLELPSGAFGWQQLLAAFLERPIAAHLARNSALLNQLLESGQAFILLDGVDEIAHRGGREHLRAAVRDAWKKYPRCRWLITSRIVGYQEVDFHSGGDRMEQRIELTEETVRQDDSAAASARVLYIAPFDDSQIERFSRNWFRRYESDPKTADGLAGKFIERVSLAPPVRALARTPNLLTLMALIYYAEAELPNGRAMLYQKIAEAYLETIDRFRQLGYDHIFNYNDRVNWLSLVAFQMQQRRSAQKDDDGSAAREILISKSDLEEMLCAAISDPSTAKVSDEFLSYIGRRTGLLIPRGIGQGDEEHYAFAHLSFQEYFAACHLEKGVLHDPDWAFGSGDPELSEDKLRGLTLDPAWQEVFYLFFEIVSSSDRSGKWLTRLIEKLFPESPGAAGALPLLSRVLADPHCVLDESARGEHIARCWRGEMATHKALASSTDGRFGSFRPEVTVNLTGETSAFAGLACEVWNSVDDATDIARLIDAAIAYYGRPGKCSRRFSQDALKSGLVSLIEEERLPAAGRALAGYLLGCLGDPRPGVTWKPRAEDPHGGFRYVRLAGVDFSIYPVTVDQFQPFIDAGGYSERRFWTDSGWKWKDGNHIGGPEDYGGKFLGPNHPRVGVSWYEAVAYCRWLSAQLGREVRLPTDAEWNKAVNPDGNRTYPWGNEEDKLEERANFAPDWSDILASTSAVGIYPQGSTPEGLYDVAGNVWEWSLTKADDSKKAARDDIEGNAARVLRGGSWDYDQGALACSARGHDVPDDRDSYGGFRVVFAPSFSSSEL